ncbi:uncharacterized protein LOC106053586 [Biomphalaria glabrata]|uniref:Uncharacterized protein LOC106053586 n=1 Tax=Biomphalaria glabrata TaxID=6526 RepID=A0A9W2YGB9_BIOGL|nr:uncharacterized protein LOC106053586 [Biomphalaria glabrata]XP_055861779.1 uncharacterized protein LOC106053586 [Biomphalaria glabrata]XP_055861780.1 uncharacterized protein LOC106053586 [Biomphalaria glabrata]
MNIQNSFRTKERDAIFTSITGSTGNIVEVFGAPMVGKSSLIDQVVQEIASFDFTYGKRTLCYRIQCKNIYTLQDLFAQISTVLCPDKFQTATEDLKNFYDMNYILQHIKKTVDTFPRSRHILVFHKCESFHANGSSHSFLSFLGEIVTTLQCTDLNFHLVFSTYKRFSLSGYRTSLVNVGMLIDPVDILHLLKQYVPGVDVIPYVYICQRYLCLPGAIVQLATQYVSKNVYMPKVLEHFLRRDLTFLTQIFQSRLIEVYDWLTKYELECISRINSTGCNPFCKDFVESLLGHDKRGSRSYHSLVTNLVIEEFDHSNQLFVHPLVLYKCSLDRPVTGQECLNKVNSYTQFIGRILVKAEKNIQLHGVRGQPYGCHRLDWPNIKHLFLTALQGDFKDIFRVAVVARRLMMVLDPNDAKRFYGGLYRTTETYGSPRESAVMEACLGHITASGAGVDFRRALEHLDSALDTLETSGPTFFYKWALRKKAIILYRMSRYPESKIFFQQAKSVRHEIVLPPSDKQTFCVSDLQVLEDDLIGEIYETIPMIFSGENEEALKKMMTLYETIHDRYTDHPDYDVLLNSIGLAFQRGYQDLPRALEWYTKSLKQRSLLVRINPQSMLVTLNNIAMIKLRTGDLAGAECDLQKALTILREGIWYQYNTALTLTHLAETQVKLKKFQDAYVSSMQSDEILKKIYQKNDYRLKINLGMFHYKLLLGDSKKMDCDIEAMTDLGLKLEKHMSDDSHHYLMSIYEHGLVVSWAVSMDKFKKYKDELLKHVEENSLVKEVLGKTEVSSGRQSLLAGHRLFIDYLKNTDLKDLELQKLMDNLTLSCPICKTINEVLGKDMWLKDFISCSFPQNIPGPEINNLIPFSSFSNISPINLCPLEEALACEVNHLNSLVRKNESELVYIFHPNISSHTNNNRTGMSIFVQNISCLSPNSLNSCIVNPSQSSSNLNLFHSLSSRSKHPLFVLNPSNSEVVAQSHKIDELYSYLTPEVLNPSGFLRLSHQERLQIISATQQNNSLSVGKELASVSQTEHQSPFVSYRSDEELNISESVANASISNASENLMSRVLTHHSELFGPRDVMVSVGHRLQSPLVTCPSGNGTLSHLVANVSRTFKSNEVQSALATSPSVSSGYSQMSLSIANISVSGQETEFQNPEVTSSPVLVAHAQHLPELMKSFVIIGPNQCKAQDFDNLSHSTAQTNLPSQPVINVLNESLTSPLVLSPSNSIRQKFPISSASTVDLSFGQCPSANSNLYALFPSFELSSLSSHGSFDHFLNLLGEQPEAMMDKLSAHVINQSACSSFEEIVVLSYPQEVSSPLEGSELDLRTMSSILSHLDYPSSLHSSTHCKELEEYFWVGDLHSQEHHDENLPSNPVYCLGSGEFLAELYASLADTGNRASSIAHASSAVPENDLNDSTEVVELRERYRPSIASQAIALQ